MPLCFFVQRERPNNDRQTYIRLFPNGEYVYMEEHGLLDLFERRCLTIQQQTLDLGWGFGDAITELCEEYFALNVEE